MNDREKLIELLESAEGAIYWDSSDKPFIEKIADHLLANGVTIAPCRLKTQWILKDKHGNGVCRHCNRQDAIDPLATHCRYCGAEITE